MSWRLWDWRSPPCWPRPLSPLSVRRARPRLAPSQTQLALRSEAQGRMDPSLEAARARALRSARRGPPATTCPAQRRERCGHRDRHRRSAHLPCQGRCRARCLWGLRRQAWSPCREPGRVDADGDYRHARRPGRPNGDHCRGADARLEACDGAATGPWSRDRRLSCGPAATTAQVLSALPGAPRDRWTRRVGAWKMPPPEGLRSDPSKHRSWN